MKINKVVRYLTTFIYIIKSFQINKSDIRGSVVEKNGISHMLKYYHQIYAKGRNKNANN